MSQEEITNKELLEAINEGFDAMEQKFTSLKQRMEQRFSEVDKRFDRLEKIIDNWPPPSTIKDLLSWVGRLTNRVKIIEKQLGIKTE